MNQVIEILNKIGLSSQESRVYLALLKLQESQTGNLCRESNIASSNIYKILESLIEKGLVNYKTQNNIRIFMPANPETLNELFLEKQKKLDEERVEIQRLISELKVKKPENNPQSNYKYFEGLIGIKSMWKEINELMDKEHIVKIYTGKKQSYENLIGFYTEHHNIRKKRKIKERLTFPLDDRELAKERRNNLTEIKFADLNNEAEWGVFKNVLFMHHYPVKKKPHGFLIIDEIFARTFEQVFDQLWEKIEK